MNIALPKSSPEESSFYRLLSISSPHTPYLNHLADSYWDHLTLAGWNLYDTVWHELPKSEHNLVHCTYVVMIKILYALTNWTQRRKPHSNLHQVVVKSDFIRSLQSMEETCRLAPTSTQALYPRHSLHVAFRIRHTSRTTLHQAWNSGV